MKKRSWIGQLLTRPVTSPVARAIRKPPHRARLAVEVLEARCLLSVVVNNPTDTPVAGEIDLRQAIVLANTNGGAQTITFDPTVFKTPQTINLSGGQLELSNTSGTDTITGPTAGVTVNGGGLSRVFQVDKLVAASISGLTITGGKSAGNGGGVYNSGSLALANCTVSGNSVGNTGGGVFNNHGTVAMTKCTISGNAANTGGGVTSYGSLALTNCTVSDNTASNTVYGGGGVKNGSYSTATLTNCTVSGNSASYGGGVYSFYHCTTTLTNCTVSGNSAISGGGVFNWDIVTATLTNCTISDNSASGTCTFDGGGGMANDVFSTATLTNCT
ncbi:MAG: right-handed parallel beta-helix repeat-containing protein, partial [Thermoguttaceae bacterium]